MSWQAVAFGLLLFLERSCSATDQPETDCRNLEQLLPPAIGKVPWARSWRDVRSDPAGERVALVSQPASRRAQLEEEHLRGDVGAALVAAFSETGIYILGSQDEWKPHLAASASEYGIPDDRGDWSSDSALYAHVFYQDGERRLGVFDVATQSWTLVDKSAARVASNPSFEPGSSRVAVASVEIDETSGKTAWRARCGVASIGTGQWIEAPIDEWHGDLPYVYLSWEPECKFLALLAFAGKGSLPAQGVLYIIDSHDLHVVARTYVDIDRGSNPVPQWSSDGGRVVLCGGTSVVSVNVGDSGEVGSPHLLKELEGAIEVVWLPGSSKQLLALQREHAPTAEEALETIQNIGENVTRRYQYFPVIFDLSTSEIVECRDFGVYARGNLYNGFLIPRVAEFMSREAQ